VYFVENSYANPGLIITSCIFVYFVENSYANSGLILTSCIIASLRG
jgi:hypothetical protein